MFFAGCVASAYPVQAPDPPALVVVVSVDQMRADYLSRFAHRFEGGLARLTAEGVNYREARHDHAFTATAAGHATLVTGVHPSRHGVVANEWWDRDAEQRVYAVADSLSPILGAPELAGRSPRPMVTTAVGDWLKDESPDSRVVSIAMKDRVAITMGGHKADGVYWYDYDSGRFITSTYYAKEYPDWVTAFNDSGLVDTLMTRVWERARPEATYTASGPDSFPAEADGEHVSFPHITGEQGSRPYAELPYTPFGDELTFAFVREAFEQYELGQDETSDLLFIGASSADFVGHRYGPFSQEVEDYYIRLDQVLGDFFGFLDERVGRGRYTVVLSSDHGVAAIPEYRQAQGQPAVRIEISHFRDELLNGLRTGVEELEVYANPRPQLFYPLGLAIQYEGDVVSGAQRLGMERYLAEALIKSPVIEDVFMYDELRRGSLDENRLFAQAHLNSFFPTRAADVVMRYVEHSVFSSAEPANHNSPYSYDQHVPLIFWPSSADSQTVDRAVRTVDVAPTIAAIIGIVPAEKLDGVILTEVARKP